MFLIYLSKETESNVIKSYKTNSLIQIFQKNVEFLFAFYSKTWGAILQLINVLLLLANYNSYQCHFSCL